MFRTSLVILFGMVSSFVFADAAFAITKAQCQSRGADCSSGVTTCADGFAAIDTCTFLLRDDGACCAPAKKNNCNVEPGKSDRICGSCNVPGLTGRDLAPAYDCGNQPCCSSNPNDTGTSPPPPESSLSVLNYTLLEEIPGQPGASGNLAKYLESLYKFTFWAIGIAALFMLTVGGFMYVTSAGNTARIGTAKTIIVDALLGLIIALFAWLFLYVLNPDLVEGLKLPGLSQVNVSSGTGAGAGTGTGGAACTEPDSFKERLKSGGSVCQGSCSGRCSFSAAVEAAIDTVVTPSSGVDKKVIKAIICRESRGNPNAQAPDGGCGLMQITNSAWVSGCPAAILDPVENIRQGVALYKGKLGAVSGTSYGNGITSVHLAAASYNCCANGDNPNSQSASCATSAGWPSLPKWACPVDPGVSAFNMCNVKDYACEIAACASLY